uniref:Putative lectin/glucanase superfamily protein n=1 Tax=viral metagenome TaxID=1070528 RepID=A0A6M3LV68_9ZZZZ
MSKSTGLVFEAETSRGTEPSSATLEDKSRNKNHGTMTNVTYTQLDSGLWVQDYDGTAYIDCGADGSLNFISSSFSIAAWVYPSTIADQYLISRGLYSVDGYTIFLDNAGVIYLTTQQGGGQRFAATAAGILVANVWQFIACVRDNTVGYIYKNGIDVTDSTQSLSNPVTSNRNYYIGQKDDGTQRFSGMIWGHRIVTYPFTQGQIEAIVADEYRWLL